jgi:two-component system, NtrC family, response regulator HydG
MINTRPADALTSSVLTPCIFDRDQGEVDELVSLVAEIGYQAIGTCDADEALNLCRRGTCRVILISPDASAGNEHAFLDQIMRSDPGVQVIVVSGTYTLESALEAIRRGATDFLPKPIDHLRLKRALDEMAELYRQRSRVRVLEDALLKDLEFHGIVGKSPVMLEVFDFARKVARHYTNVLFVGPTGSGKEEVARALHQISPVSQQRLALCNCSAFVDSLLESQLFGHVRGAFTGATESRPGLFEYANGGTVFLDEVGETSLAMQAKLLRVIQNREIQRVGSPEVRQVSVRIIAATNRDLRNEVEAGRFRKDLFYRLSSIQIRIPSLAERLDDIRLLVHFFLKKYNGIYDKNVAGLTRRAQALLLQHPWSGNVRELENVISSACLTTVGDFIDIHDLPEQFQPGRSGNESNGDRDWRPLHLDTVCLQHVQRVLEMCRGNRVRTAQILGISRTSLYRYINPVAPQKISSKAAAASAA